MQSNILCEPTTMIFPDEASRASRLATRSAVGSQIGYVCVQFLVAHWMDWLHRLISLISIHEFSALLP